MKGYPKYIATRRDFENLLKMPEHKDRAMTELQAIYKKADDKAVIAETLKDPKDIQGEYITKEIANPSPLWKIMGFKTRQEVADLISAAESAGEVG